MSLPEEPPERRDEVGFELPEPAKVTGPRLVAMALAAVLVLGVIFLVVFLPRHRAHAALASAALSGTQALMQVEVVTPKVSSSDRSIVLPGSVRPLEETVIYSRANGYVQAWKVDIGDHVKEGQVLAELETPELDQELMQARAQLAQAEAGVKQAVANRDFAKSSLDRYQKLAAEGLATTQELDEKRAQSEVDLANVSVAQAAVGTQRANLARLGKLKSFALVTAPFSGTITARNIDRGALVVAGNSAPLFKLAATDPVRVFVDVPQDVAPSVKTGTAAKITIREFPGRAFSGIIARTAGALDPGARTLSTEIRVPNADGALLSGMYADAALTLPTPHRTYEVPATCVMTGAKGVRVQVVSADGVVHLVPVTIERDLGATMHVSTGLNGGERIIKLANAGLSDGSRVEVKR